MENEQVVQLVRLWQEKKDQDAAQQLYNAFAQYRNYLMSLSVARGIDAESMLDEVFLAAINTYNYEGKFINYLAILFRNSCISAKRWLNNAVRQDFSLIDPSKAEYINTEQRINGFSDLERRDLAQFISNLPDKDRTFIEMYLAGYGWQEIRQKLGCSKSTLSKVYNRIVDDLRLQYAS